MPSEWTGALVLKMHLNKIRWSELADKLGVGKSYISQIKNGYPVSDVMKEKIETAVDEIIAERTV